MPLYIMKDKTYEVFPNSGKPASALSPKQFKNMANVLSEHLGCFIVFGMSFEGTPQILVSATSGMENLALKKFAEDVLIGETEVNFSPLEEREEDQEDGDEN